ncbi:MAG TPA: alpha/beta hydrolase [Candidatus Acidoferrum sp.]|nr:alpha/beta hydrolase [Candidatus Acidoferrum sp.]
MVSASVAVPPKKRWFWRWTKRILIGAVLLVIAAALCGIAYQAIGNWHDARRFPQEGRSVALGSDFPGVSLNLNCSGAGSPSVILDSGLGVPAVGWDFVQPEVAKFTRVCSYDRAGYGWSTAGPMPRTSSEIARELHALLTASGEKGPYVLVAHSFGGFNVRVYTGKYPADVAGLVFVDTSHEDQIQRMPPTLQQMMKNAEKDLETQKKLARLFIFLGIARLTANDEGMTKMSKQFRDEVKYLQLEAKFVDASVAEMQSFPESAEEVRASGNLGDRPLVVLTAGKQADLKDLPKGVSQQELDEFGKTWREDLQVRLAHLSTRGKQIVVPDSTHMIPLERPDTVVAAVREVCDEVRSQAAAKL